AITLRKVTWHSIADTLVSIINHDSVMRSSTVKILTHQARLEGKQTSVRHKRLTGAIQRKTQRIKVAVSRSVRTHIKNNLGLFFKVSAFAPTGPHNRLTSRLKCDISLWWLFSFLAFSQNIFKVRISFRDFFVKRSI